MRSDPESIIVKRNGISVRIYPRIRSGTTYYQVSDYSSGKRRLVGFSSLAQAKLQAELIASKLTSPDHSVLQLRTSDRAAYLRAKQLLDPTGIPLEVAVAEFVEAHRILGKQSLVEAARFHAKHCQVNFPRKSLKEVTAEFLEDKKAKGKSPRYLSDLKHRCERLAEALHIPVSEITTVHLEKFLMSLKLSSQSYMNYRRVIGTLLAFAKRRGYLPKDFDELERVEKLRPDNGEIEIFSPSEFGKLLGNAAAEFLPCLAVGGFAGLRSSEVERLSWEDIKLEERVIVVQKGKTKTGSRRLAPISENLLTWIAALHPGRGPIWQFGHEPFYDAQQETARAAGTKWKQNALRHSFISYRLALVQNEHQVALECGNSPSMIHKHYKQLVTKREAEQWFALAPSVVQRPPVPTGDASG